MKPLERRTHRASFRTGIIVLGAMMCLALSPTSARGHFAAWEQPELFAAELRAAFRSIR